MFISLLLCALALTVTTALARFLTGPVLPDRDTDLATLRAIKARQEGPHS